MPRPLRAEAAGASYHVTARGNRGMAIVRDDADRRLFVSLLAGVSVSYEWKCLAYCLLDTHYHLLIRLTRETLASGMQQLNGLYAQAFNRRYRESGHVFQGRYHAGMTESESHLLSSVRYIALNPVRAGVCASPDAWPWSSYRAAAGRTRGLSFVDARTLRLLFGVDERESQRLLIEFVEDGLGAGANLRGQPPSDVP